MNVSFVNINTLKAVANRQDFYKNLPIAIVNDIKSYKQDLDQWRVLAGKLLLKEALINANSVLTLNDLSYTEKGKPFFKNSAFQFNISHSGNLVVLVTTENVLCGIDIEMHREIDWSIFKRNFTNKEWEIINSSENSTQQFFHFWAIKESIIKADGRGVAVLGKTEIIDESKAVCDNKIWSIQPFEIDSKYSSCIALNQPIKPYLLNELNVKLLLKEKKIRNK